jgi:GPI mannosyltransferase 1 subunit M
MDIISGYPPVRYTETKGAWLYYGYQLELLGENVFFPQLWAAGMGFFAVNVGILGQVLSGI